MYQYKLGLYEKALPDDLPLTEKLLLTRQLGYDYMELCVDLNPQRAARLNWTKEERWELVKFMHENDLHLVTLSMSVLRRCPIGISEESAQEFLRTMEQGLQLACDLGARIILFNGYDTVDAPSTEETRARLQRYLPQVADLAARYGVVIGMENADQPYVDRIEKATALVKEVNSPWMRVYADFANSAVAYQGDMEKCEADIRSGRGYISAMHLKDSVAGNHRFAHYGQGWVDFSRMVGTCKELGLRIFTAELFLYPDCPDYKAQAKQVCEFLRSFF